MQIYTHKYIVLALETDTYKHILPWVSAEENQVMLYELFSIKEVC